MTASRPALRYFGGKFAIGKWIIGHFPKHTTYVEPFGGGASVLIRKAPSKIEVYNDLNDMCVTFFEVLRNRPEDLVRAINLTPYSRREYVLAQQRADAKLEQARRFYVRCWQGRGRGGVVEAGGWRFMKTDSRGSTPCDDWCNTGYLLEIAERLRNVQIESVDALRCIEMYDTPDTLFYVDPPYVQSTRSFRWRGDGYVHEYDDIQHKALAERLAAVKGMVIVSGYPSELYERLFASWGIVDKVSSKDTDGSQRVKTIERLWINPNAMRRKGQIQIPF